MNSIFKKKWVFIALILLSMNLIITEFIVRFTTTAPIAEVFNETLGFQAKPFATIHNTKEGYASFQLDQFGFNNNALPNLLPQQRYLLIGDSFLQAYQIDRARNFVSLFEQGLGENTLAYNAGVSGFDPTRADLLVNELAPLLKPTRLILVVTSSDLFDMLKWDVVEDEKGAIVGFNWNHVEMTPFRQWKMNLYGSSALLSHLKKKYQSIIEGWWKSHFKAERAVVEQRELKLRNDKELLRRFRFALVSLAKKNIPVTLLFLPVFSYGYQGVYIEPEYTLDKLEQLSRGMAFDTINVEQAFIDSFKQGAQPALGFHNFRIGVGHLNALGHQLVAAKLLNYFRKLNAKASMK